MKHKLYNGSRYGVTSLLHHQRSCTIIIGVNRYNINGIDHVTFLTYSKACSPTSKWEERFQIRYKIETYRPILIYTKIVWSFICRTTLLSDLYNLFSFFCTCKIQRTTWSTPLYLCVESFWKTFTNQRHFTKKLTEAIPSSIKIIVSLKRFRVSCGTLANPIHVMFGFINNLLFYVKKY